MRTLYIHVGLPKTGSSSIQRFLVDNRAALLAAGLGLGPFMTMASGKSLPLRQAIAGRGLPQVMAELAASPGQNLVVSDEHLSSILVDEAEATAVRDAALPHFRPVVVVFLRRQDYWHESLYTQNVKTTYAGTMQAYTESVLADYAADFDFDGCIARLERLFGAENLRVLLFRDDGPNDAVADFLAALDLDLDLDLGRARVAGRQNASPHRRKVLFLSQVPKPDPEIQDLSWFMTTVVEKTGAIADDGVRFLLAPRDRHRLVALHADGNRALLARYGLDDGGHFASPPDPDADWSPPRPITFRERHAVLAEALGTSVRLKGPRFAARITRKVASLYLRMP